MPLLKANTMNDILAQAELTRMGLGLSTDSKLAPAATQQLGGHTQLSLGSSRTSLESKLQDVARSLSHRIPAFGLLMALLSVFCFSIVSVIVKMEVSLPAVEMLVIRSSISFAVYFVSTLLYRHSFFGEPHHRFDLVARCVSGTISLTSIYVAYRMIPLSDASTIFSASPVFVAIFAYFFLKEPFTRLQIFTGGVTLLGVIIIAKPEFLFGAEGEFIHEMRFEGTCLAVISSMTAASSMISLRKLNTTPVSVVVMWYSFTVIASGSTYLTIAQKWIMPTTSSQWISLAIISGCSTVSQYFLTVAFQYEKAGPISVVRTFGIVFSFLWEVLLLDETIELTSVVGACLICSCVIVLALVKWHQESPETFNRIRNKLCCFCPTPGPRKKPSSSSVTKKVDATDSAKKKKTTSPKGKHGGSTDSIDSIAVQNTVNSNVILLMDDEEDDEDDETPPNSRLAAAKVDGAPVNI